MFLVGNAFARFESCNSINSGKSYSNSLFLTIMITAAPKFDVVIAHRLPMSAEAPFVTRVLFFRKNKESILIS